MSVYTQQLLLYISFKSFFVNMYLFIMKVMFGNKTDKYVSQFKKINSMFTFQYIKKQYKLGVSFM